MAQYSDTDRDAIDALVDRWRSECLIEDGSLIFDGETVWSLENFELFYRAYNDRIDRGEGSFDEKFEAQVGDQPGTVTRLAAEVIAIYFLFASQNTVGAARKRELIGLVLAWNGDTLAESGDVHAAMGQAIGGPGQAYNNLRWKHIAYLVSLFREFKRLSAERRAELVADAWAFKAWIAEDDRDGGEQMMRHILLHLLFPHEYERIASGPHKYRIAEHLWGLIEEVPLDDGITGEEEDVDRALLAIRQRIEKLRDDGDVELDRPLDFYEGLLKRVWDPPLADDESAGGLTNLAALELKRQVVLFGPPGTGKTRSKGASSAPTARRGARSLEGGGVPQELQAGGRDRRTPSAAPAAAPGIQLRGLHSRASPHARGRDDTGRRVPAGALPGDRRGTCVAGRACSPPVGPRPRRAESNRREPSLR